MVNDCNKCVLGVAEAHQECPQHGAVCEIEGTLGLIQCQCERPFVSCSAGFTRKVHDLQEPGSRLVRNLNQAPIPRYEPRPKDLVPGDDGIETVAKQGHIQRAP